MPGVYTLQQAINAYKAGSFDEAIRLIHIALEDPEIQSGPLGSLAYYTLAKLTGNREAKISYLEKSIQSDPKGDVARQAQTALSQLLAEDLNVTLTDPDKSFDTQERQTLDTSPHEQQVQNNNSPELESMRTIGVIGEQQGTGFFISEDGYIATTRRLTRGFDKVNINISNYGTIEGRLVYANTQIDLAIIKLDLKTKRLFPITQVSYVPENSMITAYPFEGRILQGKFRATNRNISSEWIPTTFTQLVDGGGNPMYNEQQQLIGMLTHNSGRSSNNLYGIHIHKILDELQLYLRAVKARPELAYCSQCGTLSRAQSVGAYYCEKCGGILNSAYKINRVPIKHSALYDEDIHRKCARCQSQIGYHEGRCLRCGEMMM